MSNSIRTDLTTKIVRQCGDNLWGSCAQFPVSDWKDEVEAGDTVLGYWEWVISQAEANGTDLEHLYGIDNTYGNECVVPLVNGRELCTPDFPEIAGYVRAVHHGFELAYWTSEEWRDDPEGVIGAFIGAAKGVAYPIPNIGA